VFFPLKIAFASIATVSERQTKGRFAPSATVFSWQAARAWYNGRPFSSAFAFKGSQYLLQSVEIIYLFH
jgi:hypothetical protein